MISKSTAVPGGGEPSATSYGPEGLDTDHRLVLLALLLCFFLSGFAALLYQTAWLRQFSAVFGTSDLAVAAVLAAYMAGLAGGAAVGGRLALRVRRPVLTYGVLEAGIAVSALAVPMLLVGARTLYAAILGQQPEPPSAVTVGQPVFYLLVAFIVLALPTGFMGATLPLLARHVVRRDSELGPRIALLYAINTAGAVLGTVIAGFYLLPVLGLRRTLWLGVVVNVLVFAQAALIAKRVPRQVPVDRGDECPATAPPGFWRACVRPLLRAGTSAGERLRETFSAQPAWILPVMLLSGANAFFYEVLWTRLLSHVLGGSVYAFATMLAAFLAGIALGGGFAGKVAAQRERAGAAFAICQLAIAFLSMGVYGWMGPLIPDNLSTQHLTLYAIAVLLPATVFIGATFPLAVRVLARDHTEASPTTARIYAWNTSGAIVGAVLAGFLLIPALGFEGSIKLAVTVNLALALWTAAFVVRVRWPAVAVLAAALSAVFIAYHPARPLAVISHTAFPLEFPVAPRELFYRVGRSATVLLLEEDGYFFLRSNGLPEAAIAARGTVPAQDAERWLTALPVIARPDAETMLVVGFGGGVALEGIPRTVRDVDIVELEPEVISANRLLQSQRNTDPLADPRMHVVINDARNALRLTDKQYDIIVSQPSHPWTAGASHLFTSEFLREAKTHLNNGGVFVQWISSEFVDEELLRSLAATVSSEFTHVRLYQPAPRILVFLASQSPLDVEMQLEQTGRPLSADVLHFSYMGINGVEDLLAAIALDETGLREFSGTSPISTDDDNRMATRSRTRADGLTPADLLKLFAAHDPLLRNGSWVYSQLRTDLNFGYVARRMIRQGQQARVVALSETLADPANRFLVAGLLYQSAGQESDALRAFNAAANAGRGNIAARFHLVEHQLGTLSRNWGSPEVDDIVRGLAPSAAAVIEGRAYGATRDWVSLARLDADLAKTNVTDAWYPEAVWLRAMWRTNVSRDEKRYAIDAIRLIDRALVLAPDPRLYMLRALGAMISEDPHYIVESFRALAATMRLRLRSGNGVPAEELAGMNNNIARMKQQLQGATAERVPDRAAAVLGDLEELEQLLEQYRI